MRYRSLLAMFFLLCTTFAIGKVTSYTMSDLKILAAENNFREFFAHALDVRPSQRSADYKTMVEELGLGFLNSLLDNSKLEDNDKQLVYTISKWPIFLDNEFFRKKRDYIFLKQVSACFAADKKDCLSQATEIYSDFKHDLIFSYDIVMLLSKHKVSTILLWPMAQSLAQDTLSEFYCARDGFKDVIINKLLKNGGQNGKLTTIVHQDCLKVLTPDLRSILHQTDTRNRHIAFTILKEAKQLSTQDKSLFYILNFLSKRELKSTEIDHALTGLAQLKDDFTKREKLLGLLKTYDPMPGKIFSNKNERKMKDLKSQSKLRILHRNFPEYLDAYAQTCLSYLSGTKEYPRGNPTPDCHGLFRLDKKLKLLPKSFHSQYQKATYFTK